jgi:hypothetical protein
MMLCLQGLKQLTHFDQRGFLFFDASRAGFWRSFIAALWCLPVWGLAQFIVARGQDSDVIPHFLLARSLGYVISWLAYPLLMVRVADMFAVWPNYFRYMVAYNWFQIVLQLVWLPLLLLELVPGALSPGMSAVFGLLAQAVGMTYDWFIARHGLKVEASTAAALTVIDVLLGLFIDQMIGVI